jgi:hypothetical protein
MTTWDHSTAVLRFKEKGFAISRKDVVQGLDGPEPPGFSYQKTPPGSLGSPTQDDEAPK